MKCIYIGHDDGVRGYKISDPMAGKALYSRNVNFIEVNPSPTMVQLEEDENKLVVQLAPHTKKAEAKSELFFMKDLMRKRV